MATNCPDPLSLERLAASGPAERPGHPLMAHVRGCGACSALLERLDALYAEINGVSDEAVSPLTARVLGAIGGDLAHGATRGGDAGRPRREGETGGGEQGDGLLLAPLVRRNLRPADYRLAARSGAETGFVSVRTYAHADRDILFRVLRNTATDELTGYLVSGSPDAVAGSGIEIEGGDGRWDVGPSGEVALTGLTERDVAACAFLVRTPLAAFDLTPHADLRRTLVMKGRFRVAGDRHDRIEIEIDASGEDGRTRVRIERIEGPAGEEGMEVTVFRKGLPSVTRPAAGGIAVFEELDPERILKIHVYAAPAP